MGRYIKNFETDTNAYAVRLPVGNGLIAPNRPVNGQVRYNKDSNRIEYYANNSWHGIAKQGNVAILKDQFYPNGVVTMFGPMSKQYQPGEEANLLVFIGGVFQNAGTSYQLFNNEYIEFTSAPPNNEIIVVLHNLNSTNAT